MVFVDGLRLKIVVEFDAPFTLTQITNFFNNTVKPELRDELIPKLDVNFDAGYILNHEVDFTEKSANHFEVYPRLTFSGNAPGLTKQEIRNGLETTLTNLKKYHVRTSVWTGSNERQLSHS